MKRVTIKNTDGKTATVELGHTYGEWRGRFDDVNFWDFDFEDLVNEGTDVNEEIVYWYINGRFYETDEEV